MSLPQQVRHLLIPTVVIVVGYLAVRQLLVPPTFGLWGHYRAASVIDNALREIRYAGSVACADCHDQIVSVKKTGYHNGVACETCHNPVAGHVADPEKIRPQIPRGRSYCLLCHEYLQARPTGFPQVVSESHNPTKACTACHKPHDPKPPTTPKGCDACHAKIQRTIGLSRHSIVECTICHQVPKDHKISPRANLPPKPQSRDLCGQCHAQDSPAEKEIPRVNMVTHGEKYACWQCHLPHQPEAR